MSATDVNPNPLTTVWHGCNQAEHKKCVASEKLVPVTATKPKEGTFTVLYELHPARTDLVHGKGDSLGIKWEDALRWPHQVFLP